MTGDTTGGDRPVHDSDVPPHRRAVPGWVRPWTLARFLLFYAGQLLMANAYVAWEVLTPRPRMRPGVIAVPLRCETPMEIAFLANLITLTPGTLSLDVGRENRILYVHGLHVRDPAHFRQEIAILEARLLKVLR